MNAQLEKFARDTLKSDLLACTEAQRLIFKRMYSPIAPCRPIDQVVDDIPVDKLDWAMQQVQRTIAKAKSSTSKDQS